MNLTIQEITEHLLHQRNVVNEMTEVLRAEKAKRDEMQSAVIDKLKEIGTDRFRAIDSNTTVAIAKKKTLQIVDEKALMTDLKEKGLTDYIKEQIDKDLFKGLSNKLAKEDKLMDGMELKETEYLTIRANKTKK